MARAIPVAEVKPNGNRTVIGERQHHVGTKFTGVDVQAGCSQLPDKVIKEYSCSVGLCGVRKARPIPARRVGSQRKLADGKYGGANIHDRAIHSSPLVGKYPQLRNLAGHALHCRLAVAFHGADQYYEPGSDLSCTPAVHSDPRFTYSLDQTAHATLGASAPVPACADLTRRRQSRNWNEGINDGIAYQNC